MKLPRAASRCAGAKVGLRLRNPPANNALVDMRSKAAFNFLLALPLAIAMVGWPADGIAKPQKRHERPSIFQSIARAAKSTLGVEEPRKRSKRYKKRNVRRATVAPVKAPVEKAQDAKAPTATNVPIPSPKPGSEPDAKSPEPVGETAVVVVPNSVPVPSPSPATPEPAPSMEPKPVPSTEPKPEPAIAPEPNSPVAPETVAIPAPRPALPPKETEQAEPEPHEKYEADPRSQTVALTPMPAEENSCRAELRRMGVVFEDKPAESSPDGCSMPYPVAVRSVGSDVKLEPAALMDCAMAETMAKFTSSVINPAMKDAFGQKLKSISQASAYVCRPRNGTVKLSEHAFGNALDIAQFTLADGTTVDVKPDPGEKAAAVFAKVRSAACGPFKTVLGPGSNADHALHLHFDLAPRRNGGLYCH